MGEREGIKIKSRSRIKIKIKFKSMSKTAGMTMLEAGSRAEAGDAVDNFGGEGGFEGGAEGFV